MYLEDSWRSYPHIYALDTQVSDTSASRRTKSPRNTVSKDHSNTWSNLKKNEDIISETSLSSTYTTLTEVYKRSSDVCMQLYEKEQLMPNSYLHVYGLQGSGFNAEQLAIVAALCEWRDCIARVEDESTGYILPNKVLLEIAKQMPVTASKLRRLLKSKHPYVERDICHVVDTIKRSMQNAVAFEAAAQQLRTGRVLNVSEERVAVNAGGRGSVAT